MKDIVIILLVMGALSLAFVTPYADVTVNYQGLTPSLTNSTKKANFTFGVNEELTPIFQDMEKRIISLGGNKTAADIPSTVYDSSLLFTDVVRVMLKIPNVALQTFNSLLMLLTGHIDVPYWFQAFVYGILALSVFSAAAYVLKRLLGDM